MHVINYMTLRSSRLGESRAAETFPSLPYNIIITEKNLNFYNKP